MLLRGDSTLVDPRSTIKRLAKQAILRPMLAVASGCLYIGIRNREFYEHYGVDPGRLFFTPYSVDDAFFQGWRERLRDQRSDLRSALCIDDERPIILYVGKFIPKKQPLFLLRAYAGLRRERECALVYVGDGELRPSLEAAIQSQDISDVYVTGFLNQTEISRMYAAADVLVLPSSKGETCGLTVNEGMNFGLPAVVTDRVGCSGDLVRDGENGYVVPWNDVDALAAALKLVIDADRRRAFGQRSLDIIKEWSLERTVGGIVQAPQTCVGGKRRR